jgi:hypothetical protein
VIARQRRVLVGMLAGAASLAAAVWAGTMQANVTALFTSNPATIIPFPKAFLTAGNAPPPTRLPLTAEQLNRLRGALWGDPLDQKLVNLLYVDAVRTGKSDADIRLMARTLARLGWRYTQAQQNLMVGAALDTRFPEMVDRADGLLRRQKLSDQTIIMLIAMEAVPQVHGLVVDKLLADPIWRHDYLLRIGTQAPAQILEARLQTMRTLLRSPVGARRAELVPIIQALVANGRGRAAYKLWEIKAGRTSERNLLRDPRFQTAAETASEETVIPFEWHLNQNLGYSTDASHEGVTINWDGHGVPVFINQLVPVDQGRSYMLTIQGHADSGKLQDLLAPSFGCGQGAVPFTPVGSSGATVRYRSGPVPVGCDMADLLIAGSVDAGLRGTTMDIAWVALQPAG